MSSFNLMLFPFTCRDMYNEWTIELKAMADRIISMRQQLFDALRARGSLSLSLSLKLYLLSSSFMLQCVPCH